MGKRIAALLMICLLFTAALLPCAAQDAPDMTALEAAAAVDETIPAKSAILVEQETGQVLFEKNADEPLPPASITKVMTLLLVMEALESGKITLDEMVTCSENAANAEGAGIWFEEGEQLAVEDLIKATAISSANDASVALAEHLGGSEEGFAQMMNERAQQLGMNNTHFVNASGLDAPGHISTARDIAEMSRVLLNYPQITKYTSTWISDLRDGKTQLVNTNKLVRFYNGCTGLKTGTTSGAGSCLTASATKKGLSLIAVTMGSRTSADRFAAARGLLDYGFANYTRVEIPAVELTGPLKVLRGTAPWVDVVCEPPGAVILRTSNKNQLEQVVTLPEEITAPVEAGQPLGKVVVQSEGVPIHEYRLVAGQTVDKMTIPKAMGQLSKKLIQLK